MTEQGFPSPDDLLRQAEFVRAVARAALRSDDLVDDVVQDTWVAALKKPPRLRGTLRGWLAAVTRRKAVDAIRHESAIRRRQHETARRDLAPDAEELAARAETGRHLVKAVLALDEPYRTAILLRFYDDVPQRSIAKRLGIPVETVHTRLRRGLARLRTRLADDYGDGPCGWKTVIGPLITVQGGASLAAGLTYGAGALMGKKILVGSLALAALVVGTTFVLGGGHPSSEEPVRPTAPSGGVLTAAVDPVAPPPRPDPAAPVRVPVEPEAPSPVAAAPAPAVQPEPESVDAGPRLEGTGDEPVESAPAAAPEVVGAEASSWEVDRERDLHGEVVRVDGTPVSGAELTTVSRPWAVPGFFSREGWGQEERSGPSATSDARGRFRLRVPVGAVVDLEVTARGLAGAGLRNLQAGERVRLVMQDPVRLLVDAKGVDGRVASGLSLRLYTRRRTDLLLDRIAVTDDGGRATFEGLPPGLEVHARTARLHEGWGFARAKLTLPAEGEVVLGLRVPLGRDLRGRVVDAATRRPIADATVGSPGGWAESSVRTDEDGRYVRPGWGGGGYRLHVTADGYAMAWKSVGSRQVLDFALQRGARVTGRTVDGRGAPVTDARLCAVAFDETSEMMHWLLSLDSTRTDAEGRFVLDGLVPGLEHQVRLVARGRGHTVRRVPALEAGGTLDLGDLVLAGAGSILALVRARDGSAMERQPVTLYPLSPEGIRRSFEEVAERVSDDLGRARFLDLKPGKYVVRLNGRKWPNFQEIVDVPSGGDVVEVVLCPGTRTITVYVTDDLGQPVERALIFAYDRAPLAPDRFVIDAWTDALGRVEVEVQAGVTVRIEVAEMRSAPYVPPPGVELAPDEDEVRIVLERTDVLSGTLYDPDGKPIGHGHIEVEGAGRERWQVVCGEDGSFRARLDGAGPVTLRFHGLVGLQTLAPATRRPLSAVLENVAIHARGVSLGAQSVSTDRRLEVRVLDPDGTPAPGVTVRLDVHENGRPTDDRGCVAFENLPPLPLRVECPLLPTRKRPWVLRDATDLVPDGQVVDVRLVRGAVFAGRVLLPDGSPCRGGSIRVRWVSLTPPAKLLFRDVPIEPDGRFLVVLDPAVKALVSLEGRSADAGGVVRKGTLSLARAGGEELTLTLE